MKLLEEGNRKVVVAILCVLVLTGMCAIGKLDGVAYVGGIVAISGVYAESNIRSKKITNGGKKK